MNNLDNVEKIDSSVTVIDEFNTNFQETINFKSNIYKKSYAYEISKRFLDVILSLIGIIVLSPIFLVTAVLIKIESPRGKVIFSQERVGINGKKFKMYKFRSMVHNAEELLGDLLVKNEVEGLMFKLQEDPRVTKIGRVIRRTSIDELPQLINVLKGDMSLVGPRPPLVSEYALYSKYEKQRLYVRPGCTGLWQATVRSSVGFKEMVELDLQYIKNRSLVFDIKLITITIKTMIIPNGNSY